MRVLVTGGSGFIGSHIVEELHKRGDIVANLDIIYPTNYHIPGWLGDCDIRNFGAVKFYFAHFKPDYVIHCAARARIQPSLQNPIETYTTNVLGTLNLLETSRMFRVKKFIYSASSSVYAGHIALPMVESMEPRPLNPYAYSKLMGEMLVRQYAKNFGLKTCSLRYFNVYGPRQPRDGQYATVIGIFLRQRKNNEPFTIVPDGNQRRDFTWVGDVVNANILAMESDKACGGDIFNIGAAKNYSILEIADIIGGKNYPHVFIAPRIGEARETLANISKTKKLLGWEPKISFREGIEILKGQIMK